MTSRLIPTLAVLGGCWLLLGAPGSVEAGFISVGADREALPAADTLPSMAAASDEGPVRPSPVIEWLQQHQSAWAHPFAPASTGSAGAPSTTSSPGGAPAVLLTVEAHQRSQLITTLAPDREVWLPPPFSTGIFRPPRVG